MPIKFATLLLSSLRRPRTVALTFAAAAGLAGLGGLALSQIHRGAVPGMAPPTAVFPSTVLPPLSHQTPLSLLSTPSSQRKGGNPPSSEPLTAVRDAYAKGSYAQAKAAAARMIQATAGTTHPTLPQRKEAARARHLLAFATARTKDMAGARTQFALLRTEAAALPGGGKPENVPLGSAPAPSLTEEAAYQHAVCTAALGDTVGAEREYVLFMTAYPESPLVQGAVKRIARLHGGDIPPEADAAWKRAMQTAQVREKERQRDASVCGPECLSELLRRRGKPCAVAPLAKAAGTTERGVSLQALATVARGRGWPRARGLALTHRGLRAQKLPLIALISAGPEGHFVLVDRAARAAVTVWDPDAGGVGKGASHTYPVAEWQKRWRGGIALVLE